MKGSTHLLLGLLAGVALVSQRDSLEQIAAVVIASCIGSLAPDIDHPKSLIRNKLSAPGHIAFFWMKHRTITHSLVAMVAVTLLGIYVHQVYGLAFAAGYATHVAADGLTVTGVPLLWPVSNFRYKVPLVRTGGIRERLFFFVGFGLLIMVAGWRL